MKPRVRSIRPFIGAKNHQESLRFYETLGFQVKSVGPKLSLILVDDSVAFYLQEAYVKDWVDNTMLFLEVSDLSAYWEALQILGLPEKFPGVRLSQIHYQDWGAEFFLHDPSGILWHIGNFKES
ncbi:VOC family protein [Algoriphagus namhaensis]